MGLDGTAFAASELEAETVVSPGLAWALEVNVVPTWPLLTVWDGEGIGWVLEVLWTKNGGDITE